MESDRQTKEKLLEQYFTEIEKIILSRQDPITGLLPASTAITAHGDYTDAWVRDNVYSVLSVWGLALAYRRHDPKHERSHYLSHALIKLMRGLLTAMMRQADKVERFKHTFDPNDALHAKYGTKTGLSVVGDDAWGHLQIDATSLYLLMCAQMSASGFQIVYTYDEVDFIQNLIHYISKAHSIPDYGIWERGNKINHGKTEINSSSVGMAKAALEAMDGINLFGEGSGDGARIHVVLNDILNAKHTLEGLLPKESNSKETDAALLSIIGYPAYGVENKQLLTRTREKILNKLGGKYGCKRFLLDGHQSMIEDTSRLHYEPSELREFEHIESEWPLFYTYLLLDALMREDQIESQRWFETLSPLLVESDGMELLPELYYVPLDKIAEEKAAPGSQLRLANENLPLVWAQSLYLLSKMLYHNVLLPQDIDPLGRRLYEKDSDNHPVAVSIIVQNSTVKDSLHQYGIMSETIDEVNPFIVFHAEHLSKCHARLGENSKLGLSGRPNVVMGMFGTTRLHQFGDVKVLYLPYYANQQDFYFSFDNALLVDHFRASLQFIAQEWKKKDLPILPFYVREEMLDNDVTALIEILHEIQNGEVGDISIRFGTLEKLYPHVAIERMDPKYCCSVSDNTTVSNLNYKEPSLQSGERAYPLTSEELHSIESMPFDDLIRTMMYHENRHYKIQALSRVSVPLTWEYQLPFEHVSMTLKEWAKILYRNAAKEHDWYSLRRLAELLGLWHDRIEEALSKIVIRQKRLAIGRAYSEKAVLSHSADRDTILKQIEEFCGHNNGEKILTQEIILHLGYLIRSEPALFSEMITLRTWYLVQLIVSQIVREQNVTMGSAYEILIGFSPHNVYERIRQILTTYKKEVVTLQRQENLHSSAVIHHLAPRDFDAELIAQIDDWRYWREKMGLLGHTSGKFHKLTWHLLQRCKGIVIGDKYSIQNRIGTEMTLDSTAGERDFALRIDALIQSIPSPDYRQLNIEAIESMIRLFYDNAHLRIEDDLILDVLIGHAVRIAWQQENPGDNYDESKSRAWESFYKRSPKETDMAFVEAFVYLIRDEEEYL